MIKNWFTEFRCGCTSTETIPSLGLLNEVTTPEMINKIHDIVLNDPKVKVCEITEIVSISTEHLVNILHTHLCLRKLCARWVSRLLTIDQKRIRVMTSEKNLAYFNRNSKQFLRRFVTMDKTWIHHYTPESREWSKQWVKPGESSPKHSKTQQSAGKVLASVFWDALGVIFLVQIWSFFRIRAVSSPWNFERAWIGFWIASASTVFSTPGPKRLLSVPKPQEMVVW